MKKWMLVPMALAVAAVGSRSSRAASDEYEVVSIGASCENCEAPLQGVYVTTANGDSVVLDRCSSCASGSIKVKEKVRCDDCGRDLVVKCNAIYYRDRGWDF